MRSDEERYKLSIIVLCMGEGPRSLIQVFPTLSDMTMLLFPTQEASPNINYEDSSIAEP